MGLSASDAVMLVTLPPVPCDKHLLHRKLGDEDEPFQVGGDKSAKLVGGVIRERLGSRRCRHC